MKEIFEFSESPPRISFSESAPSEFEFSLSIQGPKSSYERTMLAADELFLDGKLLPLYNAPTGPITNEPVIGQRRRIKGEDVMQAHAHAGEVGRLKVEQHPISPKAPTCTSRWKELLCLKKVQVQNVSHGSKSHRKASNLSNGMAPGRRSLDSLKDPKAGLHYSEVHSKHCSNDINKPNLQEAHSQLSFEELKPIMMRSEMHARPATLAPCVQRCNDMAYHSASIMHSELALLFAADPGLCPTTNLQMWQMGRCVSGSGSSKSSNESERLSTEALQSRNTGGNGQEPVVKLRNWAKSPAKQNEQTRHAIVAMSPRRGGAGPKGMSAGRPWPGNRFTESSRSAMTTRLLVRGLDRSYSSPKLTRKRSDQLRLARQRAPADGSRTLDRSTSYSAGVRVTPVINVPMYIITPGLRRGTKGRIFSLSHLFCSKKDKVPNMLRSSALHPHPAS